MHKTDGSSSSDSCAGVRTPFGADEDVLAAMRCGGGGGGEGAEAPRAPVGGVARMDVDGVGEAGSEPAGEMRGRADTLGGGEDDGEGRPDAAADGAALWTALKTVAMDAWLMCVRVLVPATVARAMKARAYFSARRERVAEGLAAAMCAGAAAAVVAAYAYMVLRGPETHPATAAAALDACAFAAPPPWFLGLERGAVATNLCVALAASGRECMVPGVYTVPMNVLAVAKSGGGGHIDVYWNVTRLRAGGRVMASRACTTVTEFDHEGGHATIDAPALSCCVQDLFRKAILAGCMG